MRFSEKLRSDNNREADTFICLSTDYILSKNFINITFKTILTIGQKDGSMGKATATKLNNLI